MQNVAMHAPTTKRLYAKQTVMIGLTMLLMQADIAVSSFFPTCVIYLYRSGPVRVRSSLDVLI